MTVQTYGAETDESDCERAVAPAICDPGAEADETWLDAALDWDTLESERIVPVVV